MFDYIMVGWVWTKILEHACRKYVCISQILISKWHIQYNNSVSLSIHLSVEVLKPRLFLIKLSPRTRRPKNYSRLQILTSYFYFYVRFRATIAGGPYFLLLFLRQFSHSNCRRSLLLTFTSVSAQQLPSSMGEVFLGFGRWVRRFGCTFLG